MLVPLGPYSEKRWAGWWSLCEHELRAVAEDVGPHQRGESLVGPGDSASLSSGDTGSLDSSTLFVVRIATKLGPWACCLDGNIPRGSQTLRGRDNQVSHRCPSFWGAVGPNCRAPW